MYLPFASTAEQFGIISGGIKAAKVVNTCSQSDRNRKHKDLQTFFPARTGSDAENYIKYEILQYNTEMAV